MSSDLVQKSHRLFIASERKVRPFLLCRTQPDDTASAPAWSHYLETQSIDHVLSPDPPRQCTGNISGVEREKDDRLRWWLGAQERLGSSIGQALKLNFPEWQTRQPRELEDFLAHVLMVRVQLMEAAALFYSLPAPPEHKFLTRGTDVTGDYLLKVYEQRQNLLNWHTARFSLPVTAICTATIEHRYSEGVELRFPHPDGGWMRVLVASNKLPSDAEEGDTVDVELHEDPEGTERCAVIPETWKIGERGPLSEFEHLLPVLPKDLSDKVALEEYRKALRKAFDED